MPDEKTVWAFRKTLSSKCLIEKLITEFRSYLESKGLIINKGKMVNASFSVAPK